jgi:5-formaminoimidazole-4-carboxamide-1-beta-D-ribofuranosyl 5'-monophosphate synthetase
LEASPNNGVILSVFPSSGLSVFFSGGATFRPVACHNYTTLFTLYMKKYQVTIQFEMSDDFMELVPPHRTYVNYLINKDIIDQYAVSMETQKVWITVNAEDKKEVEKILEKSPLYKFWTFEIDELFVLDGQHYRLPAVQPN